MMDDRSVEVISLSFSNLQPGSEVMGRKWFQLVGTDGKALTAADTVSVDIEDVVALRDAVFAKVSRALPTNVVASDLTVFENRSAYTAGQALEDDSPIELFGGLKTYALVVVAPTQRRVGTIMDILPQVHWTFAPEPCPRLSVKDGDRLIELPPSCVDGTGIGRPGQTLILYRRPALVKQWEEMNRCSIRTYARLWVVGLPGTGKSCAALSFAWSLDRLHWDVIWIHHSRDDKIFNCVWLQRDKKAVCVVKEETVARDLAAILNSTSRTRKTIVFLDGFVNSSTAGDAARLKCLYWQQEDEIKHRLVFVCSMASPGKEYHPELYHEIPTDVDEELGHSGTEDVKTATEVAGRYGVVHHATPVARPVKTQMCFELMSWRFEDYKEAVLQDEFFHTVAHMFLPYPTQTDPEKEQLERLKLLQAKYFVAGASARLMFDATTEAAIETLDTAIDEAPKIDPYLRRFAGDSGAANSLLARYELPYELPFNYDVRLVSDYVVRKLATLMGPRLVRDFKRACNVNPSTRGFNLEAWFFAELSHNGLAWSIYVESKLQHRLWEKSTIVFFDPDKYSIGVSFDGPTWMAPAKWNQGGYDAVFIDKAEQLVRFVQVTRAEHHTFDPFYFVMLLNRLVADDLNQVAVVELCFVVPMAGLETFRPPLSEEDFEKTVVQVACSESRATRSSPDQTFKNCSAKVMVIGVKCEASNRHPVEGSQVG